MKNYIFTSMTALVILTGCGTSIQEKDHPGPSEILVEEWRSQEEPDLVVQNFSLDEKYRILWIKYREKYFHIGTFSIGGGINASSIKTTWKKDRSVDIEVVNMGVYSVSTLKYVGFDLGLKEPPLLYVNLHLLQGPPASSQRR